MKQKIMKIHKEIKNFFSAKLLLISSHGPDVRGFVGRKWSPSRGFETPGVDNFLCYSLLRLNQGAFLICLVMLANFL